MQFLHLALLISVSTAILRNPTSDFDLDALRAVDPQHAARVEWMFTRRRRFSPCLLCKTGGRPAKIGPGGYSGSFKARMARGAKN